MTNRQWMRAGVVIRWTPGAVRDTHRLLEWHRKGELRLRRRDSRMTRPVMQCTAAEARAWAEANGWRLLYDNEGGWPVVEETAKLVWSDLASAVDCLPHAKLGYGENYERHMERLAARADRRLPLFADEPVDGGSEDGTVCLGCGRAPGFDKVNLRACGWAKRTLTGTRINDHLCPECYHEYGWGTPGDDAE